VKVQIEDNLYLESDEYQFIIKEYTGKTDGTGRELYKTHGYFPTLKSALNERYIESKVSI